MVLLGLVEGVEVTVDGRVVDDRSREPYQGLIAKLKQEIAAINQKLVELEA